MALRQHLYNSIKYQKTKTRPEHFLLKWSKSIRISSERVAEVLARGDVEIGFQQISEILPIPGAAYAGPIPEDYQKVTVFTTGATTTGNKDMALKLISYLQYAETIEAFG